MSPLVRLYSRSSKVAEGPMQSLGCSDVDSEVDFKTIQWLYNTESQVVSLACCWEIAAMGCFDGDTE